MADVDELVARALRGDRAALEELTDRAWVLGWDDAVLAVRRFAGTYTSGSEVAGFIADVLELEATWEETQRPRSPLS